MKRYPVLKIAPSPSPILRNVIFTFSGALLLAALIVGLFNFQDDKPDPTALKEFYFSPNEDNFYHNPANWSPSYPGTVIGEDSKIILQGVVQMPDFDLEIAGTMQVIMDATVFSSRGDIIIKSVGTLQNEGEIMVNSIENWGTVTNNVSASINVHHYTAHPESKTHNLKSAAFVASQRVSNEGKFDNYSYCSVGEEFNNKNDAVFNQMGNGRLIIKGKWLNMPK